MKRGFGEGVHLVLVRYNRYVFVKRAVPQYLRCWLVVVSLAGYVHGASPGSVRVLQRSPDSGLATFIVPARGQVLSVKATSNRRDDIARSFLKQYGSYFGVVDSDQQLVRDDSRCVADVVGGYHSTFRQVHHGVPVFSGMLKVHHRLDAQVTAANGEFHQVPHKLRIVPSVTEQQAGRLALRLVAIDDTHVASSTLVIVDPGWYGDPSIGPHLAWQVIVANGAGDVDEAFFIDAHSLDVLDRWSRACSIRNRLIHDSFLGPALPGALVRVEGDPRNFVSDVDAGYDYTGDFYDYLFRSFGRDSLDGLGLNLVMTVRSTGLSVPCPNAQWMSIPRQTVFCEGTVTDDIVGHEWAHGLTTFSANLIYQNQSGQLNESFSDVFGEIIDLLNGDVIDIGPPTAPFWPKDTSYVNAGMDEPNNRRFDTSAEGPCSFLGNLYADGVRWLVGEDSTSFSQGAIRDMWRPGCFGKPNRAFSTAQTCGGFDGSDSGGVHSGSSIPNHAFAMLVDGKSFNGFTIESIGLIKTGAVWFHALVYYLTPGSDFKDAFLAMTQSARDLVGTFVLDPRTGLPIDSVFTQFDVDQVEAALMAVEMNTDGRCGASVDVLDATAPTICYSQRIFFEDDFESGATGWVTQNPLPLPPTPYDWVLDDSLPLGRVGTAWMADDPEIGDCNNQDESSQHTLISPVVTLPNQIVQPQVAFAHFVATEPGFDGGNVSFRAFPRTGWIPIPESAFTFNAYNGTLVTVDQGNTNPLAGQAAFFGAGGGWGTSVIDLSSLAEPGDAIRIKFEFGKDGCAGADGWYIDDFVVFDCLCSSNSDCDDADPCSGDFCDAGLCDALPRNPCVAIDFTMPASGSVDARRDVVGGDPASWSSVDVNFDLRYRPAPTVFTLADGQAVGVTPAIDQVVVVGDQSYRIGLSGPLGSGRWSVFTHVASGEKFCLGVLSGDTDQNGIVDQQDIRALIQHISVSPNVDLEPYRYDINGTGSVTSLDLTAAIDAYQGAGGQASTKGKTLGASPCLN